LFDYNQRHKKELKSAIKIAKNVKVEYFVIKASLPWSNDVLTKKDKEVPIHTVLPKLVPSTYVPGRNTLFLSYGLSYAESINAEAIFIGVNVVDFSNYPDCTPGFIKAYNSVLKALKTKIVVKAPLLKMNKSQIIKLGTKLKVPYENTWTCYNGYDKPCMKCDSCKLRAKGFKEANLFDPALVR
jgi:7-cyano-7-deazaguanine synthase